MTADRPQPRENATNAPMLRAWRAEGALLLQHCESCARAIFYPRSLCPHCWSERLTWRRASGRGRIVSFTRVHRGLPAAFQAEAPIVMAEIALDEGATMIARIVADDPQAIRSGLAVQLVPPADAMRYALPTFTLA